MLVRILLIQIVVYLSFANANDVIWRKEYKIDRSDYDEAVLQYLQKNNNSLYSDNYKLKLKEIKNEIKQHTAIVDDLLWQDNYESKSKLVTYKEAKKYCENLKIGYIDDWKLPTLIQLKKLSKNIKRIKNLYKWFYWSSTNTNNSLKTIRGVNFSKIDKFSHSYPNVKQYVRCVRKNK